MSASSDGRYNFIYKPIARAHDFRWNEFELSDAPITGENIGYTISQLKENHCESSFAIGHKPLSKDADSRVADVIVTEQVQVRIVLHHVKQVNTQSPIQHPVIPVARRGPPRKGTARVRSERQKETSVSGFHEVRSTTCCLSLSRRFD